MANTKTADGEADRIVSIKDLAARVDSLTAQLGSLGKGGGGKPAADPGTGSVDDQVARAVAAAREQDKAKSEADAREQATQDRIKALEERAEHRPTAYSWLTRRFWGIGKDDQ
jgi:hypothetical protein